MRQFQIRDLLWLILLIAVLLGWWTDHQLSQQLQAKLKQNLAQLMQRSIKLETDLRKATGESSQAQADLRAATDRYDETLKQLIQDFQREYRIWRIFPDSSGSPALPESAPSQPKKTNSN